MSNIWKYITPGIIASGEIAPKTAEEAEAAREYNEQVLEGMLKKGKWLKCADLFKTLSVIAFAVGLLLTAGNVITDMIAYAIAALGIFFVYLRYMKSSPFSFRWSYFRNGRSPVGTKAPTQEVDGNILIAFWIGYAAVIGGVFILPEGCTVNRIVSWIALGVQLLALAMYTFFTKRHNVFISAVLGVLPILVTPYSGVFGVLMIFAAVLEEKRRRPLSELEGYPDFIPLSINLSNGGIRRVDSYDRFNRDDGINDEMESL